MNIADFLIKNAKVAEKESFSNNQLQNIPTDLQPFKEEGIDDANGFQDFVDNPGDAGSVDDFGGDSFDAGFGNGDDLSADPFGGDDGMNPEGEISSNVLDWLENVDESEIPLTKKLLDSYSKLYFTQKDIANRLMVENLTNENSEGEDNIQTIREQYRSALFTLKTYIKDHYVKNSLISRITTFMEFKGIFQRLNYTLNEILDSRDNGTRVEDNDIFD